MIIAAHPLQWPAGWRRTDAGSRIDGRFVKNVTNITRGRDGSIRHANQRRELTIADAVDRVLTELQRMSVDRQDVVISTNIRTRLDGLPRSGERPPADPGVAVYWRDGSNSAPRVMAIDQYRTVEHNLAAIAATLDAMRAIERHGGAAILERAFTGFAALPQPSQRTWRTVLGFAETAAPTTDEITAAFRRSRSAAHPDKGGSSAAYDEVQRAYAEAIQEVQP